MTHRGLAPIVGLVMFASAVGAMQGEQRPVNASFPGENGLIAFTRYISEPNGLNCEIFTVDPDSLETVNLTNTPECEAAPAWSPDGTKIAFHRNNTIWVMNANGSESAPVIGANGFDPAWSPDGSMIAFHGGNLFVIDADGGTALTLAPSGGAGLDGGPSWSPDCNRIAFPSTSGLSLINPDGTGLETLASAGSLASNGPSWSPDGQSVAFSRFPGVMVIDVNTRVETPLPQADDMYAEVPAWSPDGTQIAFTLSAGTPATQNIYAANVDGSDLRKLTTHTQGEQWSDWQPLPTGELPTCAFSVPQGPSPPTPENAAGLPATGGRLYDSKSFTVVGAISLGLSTMLAATVWIAWQLRRSGNPPTGK